jgi:5-methylcytosine-specific restriction endonuclease McrA
MRKVRYINYWSYIQSDRWADKRNEIKKIRKKCEKCGSRKNLQVHHVSYKRLGRERDSDLLLLCVFCHEEVHIEQEMERRKKLGIIIVRASHQIGKTATRKNFVEFARRENTL